MLINELLNKAEHNLNKTRRGWISDTFFCVLTPFLQTDAEARAWAESTVCDVVLFDFMRHVLVKTRWVGCWVDIYSLWQRCNDGHTQSDSVKPPLWTERMCALAPSLTQFLGRIKSCSVELKRTREAPRSIWRGNWCLCDYPVNIFIFHASRLLLITVCRAYPATFHLRPAAHQRCAHQSCTNVSHPLHTLAAMFVVRKY